MNHVAVAVLLAFSVLAALLSALGIMTARTPFDRLHYLGPASIAAPIPLACAVVIQNGITAQISIQSLLAVAILLIANPVASHALARAIRVRDRHDLRAEAADDMMR